MLVTIRRGFSLLGVLALVGCGAAPDPSAVPPPEANARTVASGGQRPPVPKIDWAPCGDEFPGTECGVAEVPLDYDHPRGETIFIALARVPASDQEHRIGSLFINPGGPGASGIDLLYGWGDFIATLLQGRYDIVGFDPRGVARSEQLRCWATAEDRDAWNAQAYFPIRREQERPYYDFTRNMSVLCLSGKPDIAAHMSTADVVRDLDLLRQAVGDERLSYLGFSYGTFIGETYAALYPNKVRAMVIDGVVDPRVWSGGLQPIVAWPFSTMKEFNEFLRLCDEAGPDNCALTIPGGAAARFQELADALFLQPFLFPDGYLFQYQDLVGAALNALYDPETWGGPDGFAQWFADVADMVLGTPVVAERERDLSGALQALQARSASAEPYYDNWLEAFYGVHCSDEEYPGPLPTWSAINRYVTRVSPLFGPILWWNFTPCADWPVSADRYVGPWSVHTSAPALVVGNVYDGITSYDGAVGASRLLQNSRLLTYAGWGHCAFDKSECAREHIARYLLDGTLPSTGTVCPANPSPFLPVALLRAAAPNRPPIVRPPPWRWRR